MDDCGAALTTHPDMRMLGGGQPAAIPEVQQLWRTRMHAMLNDGSIDRTLLNYDPPGGNPLFREAFAAFLKRECGWNVTHENIAVMPSSQSAFFLLFNLLAGQTGTARKRILFPLLPEYIGYANQALCPGQFTACLPRIVETAPHEIKYHVDFDQLRITPDIAAMCVSCPTNPTGNVLTQNEFESLHALADAHGIPLIIDNAYGLPFPGAVFTDAIPVFGDHIILTLSLSKLGLPGTRTGIVVARPESPP
jgi:valine--pyruvate aminotransferase